MDQGAIDWAKYHAGEGDRPVGYHGESGGGSSSGGGSGAPSFNPAVYDEVLKNLPKTTDLATQVNQGENNAFSDYLSYLKGQPTSVDFYNTQLEKAGIPGLQKSASTLQQQIFDTEDALRRIEPDVAATTGNSIVTEAQRRGMVAAKQKPLNENLNVLGTALGRVSSAVQQGKSDVLTLTGLNSQDQAKLVDAYKTKLQLATTQGDRALQAFSQDISRTLDVTLAKIHRGEQVSDIEAANAFELLKMQKQADLTLQNSKDNGLLTLSEGQTLYDPKTGKSVYTVPKTYKPEDNGYNGNPYIDNNPYFTGGSSGWSIVP